MVSNTGRSDSMSSRTARMRKRFSLPVYSNKSMSVNEQRQGFDFIDRDLSPERPQLQHNAEAQLHQAVRNLDQRVNQKIEEREEEEITHVKKQQANTALPEDKSKKRSRRNSISKWVMEAMGPIKGIDTATNGIYLEFNGLLYYNCEFGSPLSRTSPLFRENSSSTLPRYRPRNNPASRAKNTRYSWGGFDLAHRNSPYMGRQDDDDLVAILEHDELSTSSTHGAPSAITTTTSSTTAGGLRRRRSPDYQDNRRSGMVIEPPLADCIAADPTGHTYSALLNHDDHNDFGTENIQPFITMNAEDPAENAAWAKRKSFVRRMSLSLFGRRKTDSLGGSSGHYIGNAIRV